MWRFILLGILLVIVYFMARSALRSLFAKRRDMALPERGQGAPAEMVQDPVCGMYISKEGAFFLEQSGRTHFFCSETCRASFQKKVSSA
jgi:YHS domain-containing protein